MARMSASVKPSAMSMFSMISCLSGTTTVMGLKSTLRDSGSSALPMYPGFMVM